MASNIDATIPVFGNPTTASVRSNFATAAAEITALQNTQITGVLAGSGLTGGGAAGNITLALAQPVVLGAGGTGLAAASSGDLLDQLLGAAGLGFVRRTAPAAYAISATPLGIADGGTGALTAAAALANLGAAPLASPALVGTPTAPTAAPGDNSTQLATTAFVKSLGYGSGSITGVTAGTGLTGGGVSGAVTLALATPVAVANGGTGLSAGNSGGVPYYSAAGSLASSAALASRALVLGGGAAAAPLTSTVWTSPAANSLIANFGGAAAPTLAVSGVQVIGNTGGTPGFQSDGFAGTPYIALRRADGTPAAPTAIAAAERLGQIYGLGWDGSAYQLTTAIIFQATQPYTATQRGGSLQFFGTPLGGTTIQQMMALGTGAGGLLLAANVTGGDMGLGTVNVAAGYYIGGNNIFASPALTGTPTAPTAAPGTNTTQLATTAFVAAAVAGPTGILGVANGGTGAGTAAAALTSLGAFPIAGITNASNAAAGQIGEYLSAIRASASALALTSLTTATLATLALTAGDWDVWGEVFIAPSAGINFAEAAIGASAALPTIPADSAAVSFIAPYSGSPTGGAALAPARVNLSTATTYYLLVDASFTGTCTGYGKIAARRVR